MYRIQISQIFYKQCIIISACINVSNVTFISREIHSSCKHVRGNQLVNSRDHLAEPSRQTATNQNQLRILDHQGRSTFWEGRWKFWKEFWRFQVSLALIDYGREQIIFQRSKSIHVFISTISDKNSADKNFGGEKFSADKIFGTLQNFRHFCPPNLFQKSLCKISYSA